MSYQDDLDWLARNVHEWPDGKIEVFVDRGRLIWSTQGPSNAYGWVTRGEWERRRDEVARSIISVVCRTLSSDHDMNNNSEEIDTSAERVQKTTESVRNWHESGELPPVGAFVDVTGDVVYGDGEKGCEVIAHVEDCAVIRMSWGLGCFVARALSPHRTERDAAVEAMKALCPYKGSWDTTYRLFAEALYDAGYRAGGSE